MEESFNSLVTALHRAHQEFHAEWNKYYDGTKKAEPTKVKQAREHFFLRQTRLFEEIGKYERDFFEGRSIAIDAILDFLEVDVPAFRCGYAKEKFFRRLKSLPLGSDQIERIRSLAYKLCATDSYRREFRDLARSMIKFANTDFVERIKGLRDTSDGVVHFKSSLMLDTILNNRKDLL